MTGKRTRLRGLLSACAVAPLLVLAACSRTTDNGGNAGDKVEAARAFAQCMRDNGVPDYPDPDPNGRFGAGHERFDRDDPTVKAATEKCRGLLPGGEHQVQSPEAIKELLAFAQCMRDNGVPDFPDPDAAGKFPKDAERQAHDDPKFQAANEKCRKDLPQHGGGR